MDVNSSENDGRSTIRMIIASNARWAIPPACKHQYFSQMVVLSAIVSIPFF